MAWTTGGDQGGTDGLGGSPARAGYSAGNGRDYLELPASGNQAALLALDTGCVWGGALSAVRVDGPRLALIQVPCSQAREPGRTGS